MRGHADYCPIVAGVEVLGDRWTPLVIRELMVGSTGFNEIHRGLPRMSRTLLAQRLRTLEKRGIVRRETAGRGRQGCYVLTPAGEALVPIVWAIGHWAAEWAFGDPTDDECDGLTLLWRMHQVVVSDLLPTRRTVAHLVLTGAGAAEGWLCFEDRSVTVCRDDPGYDVDLTVAAETRQLQRWLLGRVPFRALVVGGDVRLLGPERLVRDFPSWFDVSTFAEGARRAALRAERESVPA